MKEVPSWMPPCDEPPLSLPDMTDWIQIGPVTPCPPIHLVGITVLMELQKKMKIEDETAFIDSPKILSDLLAAKDVFDELSDREIHNARTRANPYETIKGRFLPESVGAHLRPLRQVA